jgi:hypothetical protein
VGQGDLSASRRSSFGAFSLARRSHPRSRCAVQRGERRQARGSASLPVWCFACAAETPHAGSPPRSRGVPFPGRVRVARDGAASGSSPLRWRSCRRFGRANCQRPPRRLSSPTPRNPAACLLHTARSPRARSLELRSAPSPDPCSLGALVACLSAPCASHVLTHLSAPAHADLFAPMSAPRAPCGRVHPTSLPQPRNSRPRDLSAPRRARPGACISPRCAAAPDPGRRGASWSVGRSVTARSRRSGRDPADRRSVRTHREWRALLSGPKTPSIFDRYRGRTQTCAVHGHQGDEGQAGPGRTESGVLCTRSREDADMRRPSSPWSLLPLDLSRRTPTAIVRPWRRGQAPRRET